MKLDPRTVIEIEIKLKFDPLSPALTPSVGGARRLAEEKPSSATEEGNLLLAEEQKSANPCHIFG